MTAPIIITNPADLPDGWLFLYTAPTFEVALAEYERKYGAPGRVWQYGTMFFFEEAKWSI